MRKVVSLLLALSMLFVLCGCGQSSEIKSATSMMEAGDYEGALTVLTQLETDEEIATMIAECENAIAYNDAIALVNEGRFGEAYDIFSSISDYKNVSDYLAKYKTVEITLDNWSNYFEYKESEAWLKNDFNEISEYNTIIGFYVKKELDNKILLDTSDVAFEFTVDACFHSITIDFENQTTKIGSKDKSTGYGITGGTFNLQDAYRMTWSTQFPQEYCLLELGGGLYSVNDSFSFSTLVVNEFSISRAEGTFTYYEP